MDQTVGQIEAHIDRTRERLGSSLRELEHRVDTAIDWREQVRVRPYTAMGAALVGGVLLATALRPHPVRRVSSPSGLAGPVTRSVHDAEERAFDLWHQITAALVGVAATRVKDYVSERVPGFADQLRRSEPSEPALSGAGAQGHSTA